ncbi:MAG: Asp-tRNA(Asn)/Glu-tRNA(Gln) amidotransferase subunit GatC [Candidatus Mycalebacterium zealandia]|nr:MAG: Asp-tRNA(Asn)/Glu-tRNA(Gln) amidotransferase subunit GatC [Candidatus Mycalebacterium zealandia]
MTEKISKKQVENAAKLAGLEFDEKEIEQFGSYLAKILVYMENLNELDTANVPPTSHALDIKARMREDIANTGDSGKKALEGAPEAADGFFSVPKVIED